MGIFTGFMYTKLLYLGNFAIVWQNLYFVSRNKSGAQEEKSAIATYTTHKKGSIIRCECGFEIPIIPDVKAVGTTIDAHIEEHRRKHKDPAQGEIAAKHIHDYLFKALFEKIAQP